MDVDRLLMAVAVGSSCVIAGIMMLMRALRSNTEKLFWTGIGVGVLGLYASVIATLHTPTVNSHLGSALLHSCTCGLT